MVIKNSHNQFPHLCPWPIWSWISFTAGVTNWFLFSSSHAMAQITPDGTVGTAVNPSNGTTEITGGTRANTNLFHSFQDFSVETGGTAFFNNAADIDHIIGRVTGKNISTINGLIQANGNVNLVLINPNGINFGANARLDLGGSFLGSTADSVIFEDGTTFSANDTQAQPILTVNTPIGLQLGQNSSGIEIQGEKLAGLGSDLPANPGLSLTPGNTLALVGNGITFDAGVVSSQSGRIDFGSVATGEVSISPNETGWQLGYEAVTQFADLELSASSSINSVDGGQITIEADQLNISDRSLISSTTLSSGNGGNVDISAADINITGTGFLEFQQNFQLGAIRGTLTPEDLGTGIFVSTITTGKGGDLTIEAESLKLNQGAIIFSPVFTEGMGGDININVDDIDISASALQMGISGSLESSTSGTINLNTQRLQIRDGGTIVNTTLGNASTGNIKITASESIKIGNTPIKALAPSGIYANTFGAGQGGDINIETTQLQIIDGLISSNTGGVLIDGTVITTGGQGGSIDLQANESIEASGILANPIFTSGVGTSSYSNADAGDITIATNKLTIKEGADFATATLGKGKGGQMTINATESVELVGVTTPRGMNRGGLLATSGRREFPDLSATGSSGNIRVNTSNLTVRDGASIDVQSIGMGDAGSLNIDADTVTLSNRASLSASTQFGTGGDIQITANNFKLNQSLINASVLGEGVGGNIRIAAKDSVEVFGSGFDSLQGLFFTRGIPEIESLANLIANIESSPITEGIVAFTTGNADAGVISIETADLQISDGGLVATTTGGNGAAGSIFFDASENLKVNGSIVSSSSLFAGQGGDIVINTKHLEALAGSQITTSTLGSGNSGDISINATKSTTVAGSSASKIPSNIAVGAQPLPITTGSGGDLTISTTQLNINDGGIISVNSTGTGNAGTLTVNADSIFLDRGGIISADTQSGKGGNILLDAEDIILQGGSASTATAAANGNGGNITVDANNLIALEGSQIIANAFAGMGGNIQVDTQGLFICESCQISASSQLGVDGLVDIETLQPNSQLEVLNFTQQPTQAKESVAVGCSANTQAKISELTITGRGGLPPSPQQLLNSESIITPASLDSQASQGFKSENTSPLPSPAQSWYVNKEGIVVLSARILDTPISNSPRTTASCQ